MCKYIMPLSLTQYTSTYIDDICFHKSIYLGVNFLYCFNLINKFYQWKDSHELNCSSSLQFSCFFETLYKNHKNSLYSLSTGYEIEDRNSPPDFFMDLMHGEVYQNPGALKHTSTSTCLCFAVCCVLILWLNCNEYERKQKFLYFPFI